MNVSVSEKIFPLQKNTRIDWSPGIDPSWQLLQLAEADENLGGSVLVSAEPNLFAAGSASRLDQIFDETCKKLGNRAKRQVALDYGDVSYSYADLRDRANRLARFFQSCGIVPDTTVALLLQRTIDMYATILALSRLDAAFVPLDEAFPEDRITFILNDSECDFVISLTDFEDSFVDCSQTTIKLDEHYREIAKLPTSEFSLLRNHPADSHVLATDLSTGSETNDPLAYIIYTSGSTGRPKGVPICQSAICNFLEIAKRCYGYQPTDRVYQSLTIAFDFSFEEIWVPLAVGASLVPAPPGAKLAGDDLHDFLETHRVTALCVVPTLLATLKPDLSHVRFLLVSGEACPADLIEPWFSDERRIINAYGPTETTVTATWSVMRPGQPVTIGGPLPTYSILITDPDTGAPLPPGETGEICIAGIGLANGYRKRPDQTVRAFIDDELGMPDNPGGKIYRTGDLGRITETNQIEYLGRIDTQVKIRGYRIELGEIEALIRSAPSVEQAVVEPYSSGNEGTVLAAYIVPASGAMQGDSAAQDQDRVLANESVTEAANDCELLDVNAIDELLRSELPSYMVPLYYEQLDTLPILASDKVDRASLPEPVSGRFIKSASSYVEPRTELENSLAELLADTLKVEQVSVEADFFDELGADSLILANYIAGIRKKLGIKRISMRKLYENTSIVQLAALLDQSQNGAVAAKTAKIQPSASMKIPIAEPRPDSDVGASKRGDEATQVATAQTGSEEAVVPITEAQSSTLSLAASASVATVAGAQVATAREPATRTEKPDHSRHIPTWLACVLTSVAQVLINAISIFLLIVSMVLCYRWASSAPTLPELFFRTVVSVNLVFFGTASGLIALKWITVGRFTTKPVPIYSVAYLRFWTAQRAIRSNPLNLLVGTPLYSVYLRLLGMSVGHNCVLLSAPPTCTDLVVVGSNTVIRQDCLFPGYTADNGYLYPGSVDIGSDVLICEATVLDINTSIGDGAQLGTTSSLLQEQRVPAGEIWQGSPAEPSSANFDRVEPQPLSAKRKIGFAGFHLLVLCLVSLPVTMIIAVLVLQSGMSFAESSVALSSAAMLLVGLGSTAMVVLGLSRFLNLFLVPEVSHPVYGAQYELARTVNRVSNNRMLNTIFGDSSMIVYWLSLVGYDLSKTTQTGSNFGVDQRHHAPFLCSFDRNTLVSDGLLMMNMETTSSAFKLRQVSMPPDTYVGNVVHYPADSRLGPNCLIATKAAIPIDGEVRKNVGILGSPSFEIPRSVARDQKFDHFKMPGILEKRLQMKLRSNLVTLALYLLRLWVLIAFALAITSTTLSVVGTDTIKMTASLTAASMVTVLFSVLFSILCERVVCGFEKLKPQYCSLYDRKFWAHERFWKLNYNTFIMAFNGTPMKSFFLRLQGARVGRCVFDDGAGLTEPSMTEIGDNCMLNLGSSLQCHSLEDGTFKSDRIILGADCTVGVGGFVHYGSTMMDGSTLRADSFLMKGTVVEGGSIWHGNPARDEHSTTPITLEIGD